MVLSVTKGEKDWVTIMSFAKIIEKYRTQSFSTRDQGYKFERLMKAFLLTDRRYSSLFDEVWLWSDFPSRKDFGSGVDTGIDLVAHEKNGNYWAIQCKCFDDSTTIDKPMVDTFLSSSGRSFSDVHDFTTRRFARRLWLDTTTKGFNKNAEDAIKNQLPPVSRLGFYDLANSEVDWDKLEDGLTGASAEKPKYGLREHQQRALNAAHDYFQFRDRGKLIMACGTGKTFTALKIVEDQVDKTTPTALVLVPSIALLGQLLNEWCAQADKPIHPVCICSDPKASQKVSKDEDSIESSIVDLALPASTNYNEIESQVSEARLLQQKDGGMVVVFSTYQSIDVISNVQKRLGGKLIFDITVCDEAHRTTGVTLKGDEDSNFVKVHDPEFIHSKKRMYMTATPRLYSDDNKKKAVEKEAYLCSMDDPAIYGEEIFHIGFGEAVEKNLLSDYKVLVLTIAEDQMSKQLQQAISIRDSEISTDDSLKLIGCINALSKRTSDTAQIKEVDPGLMHSAVAFCQTIKASKLIVSQMNSCKDAYYETLSEEDRKGIVTISAKHIDGSMGANTRSELLSWLKNVDIDSSECRMLMNVRCLSEGVDVPSLDAVLFLSARNSQVDVVQSVGRVMRRAAGKRYGYIIIPVVIPANVKPEDALDDNERFKVVWSVLQALRAHDDRFEATINKIDLNKKKPSNIVVSHTNIGGADTKAGDDADAVRGAINQQMELNFETYQNAIFAKMVEKCGERRYWEQWAADVARIAERHIYQITQLIHEEGSKPQKAFERYIKGLRKNINPSVTEEDAVQMLAQHFITQPVFDALFQNYSFAQNNPMSKSMQQMVDILNERTPQEDSEKLEKFYESVRRRAKDIDNAEAKQKVIVELYEKFFKTAFPKTVEKLGIVYTPVEIVDFIINSVEDVLKKEFGRSISDENVHVLDPFTGTGTFIVRLLQSGIIKPEDMARKYKNELHACEIVLLAYYIASINIENVYHDFMAEHMEEVKKYEEEHYWEEERAIAQPDGSPKSLEYQPFNGICLTDTFQMTEDNSAVMEEVFPQNSARVNKLKKTPITVIISNPPYSIGQKSANDAAQNQHYDLLEERIEKYYVQNSSANLNKAAYDSYIKAFRWATDRFIKYNTQNTVVEGRDGVIGFVSNGSWLDNNGLDGFRKSLEKEFSSIYVFNLRGNCRTTGELRRKEAGNVFGLGSRTPIAITILVKKKDFNGKAKIHYFAVDDYLKREDKLELVKQKKSVLNPLFKTIILKPNEFGDWITIRNDKFSDFIPLCPEKKYVTTSRSFFTTYSLGIVTSKDYLLYDFSKTNLSAKVQKMVSFYNEQRYDYHAQSDVNEAASFVKYNKAVISWTDMFLKDLENNKPYSYNPAKQMEGIYRPYCKQQFMYEKQFIQRTYQQTNLFPETSSENLMICITGIGSKKDFSALISNMIPSYDYVDKTQCLPMNWYKEDETFVGGLFDEGKKQYIRNEGVSDFILKQAQDKYGPRVTKEDIFYYVYGILHSESYRTTFEADLKKTLPRLPLLAEPKKFWDFSKAGRQLAELHLNYESVEPCSDVVVSGDDGVHYDVEKMRFPAKGQKDTIIFNSRITVKNIPDKSYEYIVNGKSAIEWIMERYAVTTDKASGIVNDPNDWAKEHNKPRYILDLLLSVINVSIQTVDIVKSLPEVDWDKE